MKSILYNTANEKEECRSKEKTTVNSVNMLLPFSFQFRAYIQ